jgi:hypothetical protein
MRHSVAAFGWALLAAAFSAVGSGSAPAQAHPPEPAPRSGQRGRVIFDASSTLLDVQGHPLARFSGGESAVTLLSPPVEGSDSSKIETGTGRGSFRLRGFIKATELRIYTNQTVPIVSGHVWLAAGTRVTAAGFSAGKVRVDKTLSAPFDQTVSATTECSALTFSPPKPAGSSAPVSARVFVMKGSELELFEAVPPTGPSLLTLRRAQTVDEVRFFSREQRGGFVHVRYEGDLNVDAWARAANLTPLPRGETIAVPSTSYTLSSPPQLQIAQPPRSVKTTHEVALRVVPNDAQAPIGVIEPDTDVLVMDTLGAWAKVLPKSLHVLPFGEQSFWVKSADLAP